MSSTSRTDRILSLSAIVAAIAAVAVAVYEARITREHQKASVWPSVYQYNTGADGLYTREIENRGLGPALVQSFQVRVDGEVRRSWSEVILGLTGETHSEYVYGSLGRGSVLLPARPYRLLSLPREPIGERLHAQVNAGRLSTRVCYCSVYGDCWVDDSSADGPEPISRCEAEPELEFTR